MRRSPLRFVPIALLASCAGREERAASGPSERDAAAQLAEYVVDVFEDRRGVLWFGTIDHGVARFDGRSLTYLTERDGLCGNTIASIAEDASGALWFGGHAGVCRFDGTTFTRFFDREGSVRTDRGGSVWASTNDRVYRQDGDGFRPFDVPLPSTRPATHSVVPGRVTFQLEDRDGNWWFATDGHGAWRYAPASGAFTQFTKKDGLCGDTVWSIVEDRRGWIWFASIEASRPKPTRDGGVCRYDGRTFTAFPDVAGLGANDVYTIRQDRSGNVWIGATGVGAYRFDGREFVLFDRTDRPDLTSRFGLQALLEDRNGTLWCGFSGGLFRFDGLSFVNVTREELRTSLTRPQPRSP